MTEQLLDDPQVRATLEQMGRERMPQRVRADSLTESGATRGRLHGGPRLLASEASATTAHEQRPAANRRDVSDGDERGPCLGEPPAEPVQGNVADGHHPLAIALA